MQYPPHILKKQLTPEECFAAVEECGAPMVSIPGGEPLLHPQIVEIVNGLVARKKYIYLCTNALELKRRLPEFTPSKYLTFSVHLDGQREHHDFSVCREGGYDIAVEGIKEAVKRGFRVTTNATFFDGLIPTASAPSLMKSWTWASRASSSRLAIATTRLLTRTASWAVRVCAACSVPSSPIASRLEVQYVAALP